MGLVVLLRLCGSGLGFQCLPGQELPPSVDPMPFATANLWLGWEEVEPAEEPAEQIPAGETIPGDQFVEAFRTMLGISREEMEPRDEEERRVITELTQSMVA